MYEISFMTRFKQQHFRCFTVRCEFWVIEQHAVILSAPVRSPTVIRGSKGNIFNPILNEISAGYVLVHFIIKHEWSECKQTSYNLVSQAPLS